MSYEHPEEGTPEQPQPPEQPLEQPPLTPPQPAAPAHEQELPEEDLGYGFDDDDTGAEAAPDAAVPGAYEQDDRPWMNSPPYVPGPPLQRSRAAGWASAVAVVVLGLGLIGLTAWTLRLYRQQTQTAAAASQLLGLMSERAPEQLAAELTAIQSDLAGGSVDQANARIARLRAMASKLPASGEPAEAGADSGAPIPEEAYKGLPPDAATFFRANTDLFRRFLMMCDRARELRDSGRDVTKLRVAREEIIEAARLGQKGAVQSSMLKMAKLFGGRGGRRGGPEGPGPLRAKADRLREAVERARRQGRDIRPVMPLMQQAEQAAQGGNMAAAGRFLDQALAAARRAPKLSAADARRMRMGARGGMRGGPAGNPLAPFVRALLGVMGAEEQNLRVVANQLLQARGILFGDKPAPEQPALLKPLVDKAMNQMQIVADRRKDLQAKLSAARRPNGRPLLPAGRRGRGSRPGLNLGAPAPEGPEAEARKGMLQLVRLRLGAVVDRIRAMSDEDYAKNKAIVIRDILQAVFTPPTAAEQAQLDKLRGPQTPPVVLTPQARAEALRKKMLQASPTLRKWELEGKDTAAIEDLFTAARKCLYAGKLDEAEKAVEQAMTQLGLTGPALAPTTVAP